MDSETKRKIIEYLRLIAKSKDDTYPNEEESPNMRIVYIPLGGDSQTSTHLPNGRPKMNLKTKLTHTNTQMEKAVLQEDYEFAIKCRDEIKRLEGIQKSVDTLMEDKLLAIETQDFEKAMELDKIITEMIDGKPKAKKK